MEQQELVTRLYDTVDGYASGARVAARRTEILDELAAISTDPDPLAEAAAQHAMADNWYAILAVDLLMEAGAEPKRMDDHL